MKKVEIRYATDKYSKELADIVPKGPVITISREFGCPANDCAAILKKLIEQNFENSKWQILNRYNLNLNQATGTIEKRDDEVPTENLKFEDITDGFTASKYILKKENSQQLTRLIREQSQKGNIIVVGRGGVAITRDIVKSLHIRLFAPMEWRAARLCQKYKIKLPTAQKYAEEFDAMRKKMITDFRGSTCDLSLFDVAYNCMKYSEEQIAESIFLLAFSSKLFEE